MVDEFFVLINTANIKDTGKDHWIQTANSSNFFMVKSTYLTLHNLKIGSNKVEVFKPL